MLPVSAGARTGRDGPLVGRTEQSRRLAARLRDPVGGGYLHRAGV